MTLSSTNAPHFAILRPMQTMEYKPLTIGDWLVTKLVLAIPFVGFIMLFVWALSSDTHPSKKTFCQSVLIVMALFFVLGMIIVFSLGGIAAILSHRQFIR